MKEVKFKSEARAKILEGINLVADTVAATLGPRGGNAILDRGTAPPIITNDGVSIAQFFNKVEDPWVNVGVQMIKEVGAKQNEPGDGTTTATILAAALVNEADKFLLSGISSHEINEGIHRAADQTIETLKKSAKQISSKEDFIQVATISVEDEATGKLIGEMMHQVGKDGGITVETSKEVKLEKDMAQGIKFEQGFITRAMMTNPYRQEAVYEGGKDGVTVPILVTDHVISTNDQFVPLADALLSKGIISLVIICDDMKGEALNTAITNTMKQQFNFLVIRLPGLDEQRTRAAEDIAIATGAAFIDKNLNKLEEVIIEDLGEAQKVVANRDTTIIVNGGGDKKEIDGRIKELKAELKSAISDYERDQLKERIARLSEGIGVVRIGAATEQELMYKKHKIEDALAATRAAAEEGIVAGGGVALLQCIPIHQIAVGEQIFWKAIKQPITWIAQNAGQNPETIIQKVEGTLPGPGWGWDAKNNKYTDLFEVGIVDPLKVTRKAIENAVSMATMMISSSSLIVDVPEQKESLEQRVASGRAPR